MGVTPKELSQLYPCLYHMAHKESWESIRRHGLFCTEALLDLFGVPPHDRPSFLTRQRPECVVIRHPTNGSAVIRDQKPLNCSKLEKCLKDCSLDQWLLMLNSRVFFWLCKERLETLMCAREYCGDAHLVLVVDTLRLASDFQDHITLAPMNTGNTRPYAHPRGLSTFSRMEDYPFTQRLRHGLYYTVVELAVENGVPNVMDYVIEATLMRCTNCEKEKANSVHVVEKLYPKKDE
jgi:Family of unknown function (DUF7002)